MVSKEEEASKQFFNSLKEIVASKDPTIITSEIDNARKCIKYLINEKTLRFNNSQTLSILMSPNKAIATLEELLAKKFEAFKIILSSNIKSTSIDTSLRTFSFKVLLELSKYHFESVIINTQTENTYDNDCLLYLSIETILDNENPKDITTTLTDYLSNYDDFALGFINGLYHVMQDRLLQENFTFNNQKNFLRILQSIPQNIDSISYVKKFINPSSIVKLNGKRKNPFQGSEDKEDSSIPKFTLNWKKNYEKLMVLFLKIENLSMEILEEFLLLITKKILPNLNQPIILADFLIFFFEKPTTNVDIQILSLSSLFMLIAKHSLDYPNYYNKLYIILKETLLVENLNGSTIYKSKYKTKFLKLLETSLRTSKLSAHLVASFIKILSRICLKVSPSDILWNLALIFNLLKKNPICLKMIKSSEKPVIEHDLYDLQENDILNTKALDSKLWELKSLKNHYSYQVRKMISGFDNIESNDFLDIEDFENLTYEKLMKGTLEKAKNFGENTDKFKGFNSSIHEIEY